MKTQLVDRTHWAVPAGMALGYVVTLAICVGVGSNGPAPITLVRQTPLSLSNLACADAQSCTVTHVSELRGLSSLNQALWLRAWMSRPFDASRNRPALVDLPFNVPVTMEVDVMADGKPFITNSTRAATFSCQPGQLDCGGPLVLAQAFLYNRDFAITVRIINPLKPWLDAGIPFASLGNQTVNNGTAVGLTVRGAHLNPAYTQFQVAGKYTFFVFSVVITAGASACSLERGGLGVCESCIACPLRSPACRSQCIATSCTRAEAPATLSLATRCHRLARSSGWCCWVCCSSGTTTPPSPSTSSPPPSPHRCERLAAGRRTSAPAPAPIAVGPPLASRTCARAPAGLLRGVRHDLLCGVGRLLALRL